MSNNNEEPSLKEHITEKIDTKQSIREKVWNELKNHKQTIFPWPFGRIPNFKGSKEVAAQLLEIPEFKSAQSIEVNPDKPLEACRILVLEQGKHLYVPISQLQGGLLKKLEITENCDLKKTVSRWGISYLGKEINLNDKINIDLLIVGSVAVSKDGYRIGKGKGFADLEFALLKEMKAIDDNTVIITVVHDIQVFETLPNNLFEIYDVPVDIIVTPTQIIRVENKLPKPKGIYWNLLRPEQVQRINILKDLRKKYESEGVDVTLKSTTVANQKKPRRFFRSWKRQPQKKSTVDAKGELNAQNNDEKQENPNKDKTIENTTKDEQNKDKRPQRKRRTYRRHAEENQQKENENNENLPPKKKKRKNIHDGYSLCVSNIEKTVRVRDLKSALQEKGIRPNFIVWKGFRGFCYLHYSTKKKVSENPDSFAIDNIIEKIQAIKINPTEDRYLDVEVMDPITRIETVNVTSV